MIKAALFDLDGVIFDTEAQYSIFWGGEVKRYFPESEGLEQKIKGQTLPQIFEAVFSTIPEEHPAISERLNAFEAALAFNYVPGFVAFVQQLRKRGIAVGVVTSSTREKMANVYRAHPEFQGLVDRIFTAEEFPRSKPFPDCYLLASAAFGVAPEECVGFEDSFNGLKAVRAAGMRVIGLATTNAAEEILPYCDAVISDFLAADNVLKVASIRRS